MSRGILMVCVLLCGTAAVAAETQHHHATQAIVVEQAQQRYVYPDPEIPTLRDIALQAKEGSSEAGFEQYLWDLLAAGRLSKLKQTIAQRQAKIADWQPPPWLKVELARAELNARINAARGKLSRLLALFAEHPELFTCHEYYNLWSLADGYRASGELRQEQEIHRQMLASCSAASTLLTTLDRVAEREGEGSALQAAERLAQRSELNLPTAGMSERRYRWSISHAAALRAAGRREEATTLLEAVAAEIEARRDLDAARLTAWNYRERELPVAALYWFERIAQWSGAEEDRVNLLQLRWVQGEYDGVLVWLRDNELQESASRHWAAGLLRGAASNRFAANDYVATLELLDLALRYEAPEPADLATLRGWALYKQQRYGEAHRAFAEGYRQARGSDAQQTGAAADGLLYTAQASGDWRRLLQLADSEPGPLLSSTGERSLVEQLAAGSRSMKRLAIRDGHLSQVAPGDSLRARLFTPVEGAPGYTWGSLRDDNLDKGSASYLLNQGIDWWLLPGGITLNTYLEYRGVRSDWGYLNNQTEGVAGGELRRAPFRLGMEYIPAQWRSGENSNSPGRGFFSWYDEWRVAATAGKIAGYSGSTYGRVNANINGPSAIVAYLKQGIDWFTLDSGLTLNSYAAYRLRFRNQNNEWYDAHGPALGVELQRKPFNLGVDYAWEMSPQRHTTERRIGIYLTWYYGWDLKPE